MNFFNKTLLIVAILLFAFVNIDLATATTTPPSFNCIWLPGCKDSEFNTPEAVTQDTVNQSNVLIAFIWNVISELIKYVAVFAVIWIIISWLSLMFSWWNEEKATKAKTYLIWAIAWVIVAWLWYTIIDLINNIIIQSPNNTTTHWV